MDTTFACHSYQVFNQVTQRGSGMVIHNIRLTYVRPSDDGHEILIVENEHGASREVQGAGRWDEETSRTRNIGKNGYLKAAHFDSESPARGCYFWPYIDQSLRRLPELDRHGNPHSTVRDDRHQAIVGWGCDSRPDGFCAPLGIIPGSSGQFVPDETQLVSLRVPPEFIRECYRFNMLPEELLRSFVGDLAGIHNLVDNPRSDGYGSNGSDERMYASQWLDRAHGFNEISLDELE